jgi:hypothetical protein
MIFGTVAVGGGVVVLGFRHTSEVRGDTEIPVQMTGQEALAFGMLIPPLSAAAQTVTIPSANPNSPTYPSPLGPNIKGLTDLLSLILTYFQSVAIPFAVIAVVIVGIRFIYGAATGNQALILQSRTLLLWILIGAVVVIGAKYLADAMINLLKNITQTPTYIPPSGGG